jgi:hypothetical protein
MNGSQPGPEKEKARAVVRQLGGKSIPLLLKWLRQEDRPSLTARFDEVRQGTFFWLVRHKLIPNRSITALRDFNPSHSAMAIWALPELDHPGRVAAIPALIRMLGAKNPKPDKFPPGAGGACMVLSKMAPESTEPLIGALSSHDVQTWTLAASALGQIGPAARAAIPILETRLRDKDPNMRVMAAGVIGKLGGDPNKFLPVVIQSLPEMDSLTMLFPLDILVRYKDHAEAAVPILIGILTNTPNSTNPTNSVLRYEVMNALRQIDPEALAKAGAE